MIACSGMYWPEGSHNGPRPKAEGHYACTKVNTKAVPLQATINLFINWLLGLTLTSGLTRPLWDLLCHYGFY